MTEEPKYLMRFVGFKEDGSGELKRGAPGSYKDGELKHLPFSYSLEPYWEIVDNIPDLEIPEAEPEDSVYKDQAIEQEVVEAVDESLIAREVSEEKGVPIYQLDGKHVGDLLEDGMIRPAGLGDLEDAEVVEVPEVKPEDTVYADETEEETPLKLILPIEQDMETVDVIDYESMTVSSLKHFIEQRGGKVESKWLKPDLVREAGRLEEISRAASESS